MSTSSQSIPASQTIEVGGKKFTILFPHLFRPLTDQERVGLMNDIKERGMLLVPIVIDENLGVIDGYNRLQIAAELGLEIPTTTIRPGLTAQDKEKMALALNQHRRQLTCEDRTALEVRLRQEGMSYRAIGERVGVSDVTVMNDLKGATAKSLAVALPDRVTGKDGKSHPARLPRKKARVETKSPSAGVTGTEQPHDDSLAKENPAAAVLPRYEDFGPLDDTEEALESVDDKLKKHNHTLENFCRQLQKFVDDNWPGGPWLDDMGRGNGAKQKIKDACSALRTAKAYAACPRCEGEGCFECHKTGVVPKHAHELLC